jgi:hypothetical protein
LLNNGTDGLCDLIDEAGRRAGVSRGQAFDAAAAVQAVAQRLRRDVQSDLVTEFAAVDDGLGWGVTT